MRFFTSPPLTVSDVMAWVNNLFGGRIPTLPFPPSWWQSLTTLWNKLVVGQLPDPDEPKPWRIDIEGTWQPFAWCDATFDSMAIVIYDAESGSPSSNSPPLPFDEEFPAPRRKRKAPQRKTAARTPGEPGRRAPAKRPREPAGLLGRMWGRLSRNRKRFDERNVD